MHNIVIISVSIKLFVVKGVSKRTTIREVKERISAQVNVPYSELRLFTILELEDDGTLGYYFVGHNSEVILQTKIPTDVPILLGICETGKPGFRMPVDNTTTVGQVMTQVHEKLGIAVIWPTRCSVPPVDCPISSRRHLSRSL